MILSSQQPSTQWALLNKAISSRVMRITQIKKLHTSEKRLFYFASKLSGIAHNGFLGTGLIVHEVTSSRREELAFPITFQCPFCPHVGTKFACSIPLMRHSWIECMLDLHFILFKAEGQRCLHWGIWFILRNWHAEMWNAKMKKFNLCRVTQFTDSHTARIQLHPYLIDTGIINLKMWMNFNWRVLQSHFPKGSI